MNHSRHIGIFNASHLSVSLVGAGGIGAMTALVLAKMGVETLTIYDGDVVAPENMPTQLHRLQSEGEAKVAALRDTLALFSDDTNVIPIEARVTAETELYGQVLISAVDSIAARKAIWAAVQRSGADWYIDSRMSAEEFQMYVVDLTKPEKVAMYGEMIMAEDDSKIPEIPCTAKATFFCASIASGHIGATVRKIITGNKPPYYTVHNMLFNRLFAIGEA